MNPWLKNKKDFLSITDLSPKEILEIFFVAKKLKQGLKTKGKHNPIMQQKTMVMLFEKPSLRTKLSFDISFHQLGGHPIYFGAQEVGLGKREKVSDVAKVISSMADIVVARVFSHAQLQDFAMNATIPVINALSDMEHPCQILADLLTIYEIKGELKNLSLAYVGDAENNIAHSLALGCALLGIHFHCAAPSGYSLNKTILKKAQAIAQKSGSTILETGNPVIAVKNADVVYTDTWVSMGEEEEKEKRLHIFKPYQINQQLLSLAKKDALFMHDMPAYRGNEVTDDVIDGSQSVIFEQAENRLHAQKALIIFLSQATNLEKQKKSGKLPIDTILNFT